MVVRCTCRVLVFRQLRGLSGLPCVPTARCCNKVLQHGLVLPLQDLAGSTDLRATCQTCETRLDRYLSDM